jgi:GH43 family beta-xylosidase
MQDTKNIYVVEMDNGSTLEIEAPLENKVQLDWLIDAYYKGRIARFWVNGVEWLEPTE